MRRTAWGILMAAALAWGQPPAAKKDDTKTRALKYEKGSTGPLTPASAGVAIPRSYAVVIGIGNYKNLTGKEQLAYSEADAELMYSILISPEGGNFRAENVHKRLGKEATRENIRQELEEWLPSVAKEDDRVLVYFAGHGFVDPNSGKAYLAPYDFEKDKIGATGYGMDRLGEIIGGKVKAKWKVLLTDSCHSGAITPEQGEVVNRSLLDLNRSMFSMTASRARELSYEGSQFGGGHGVFTYFLARGLEGYADESKDGIVTADELADYVRRNVREQTANQQSPTSDKGNFDPNMLLAFNPTGASLGDTPPPKFGEWVIESNMDEVEVFVDGKSIGVVSKGKPLPWPGLTPGVHTVKGVRNGYEPDGPRDETVYPGQKSTISIKITIPRRRTKAALDALEKGVELYQKGTAENYRKAASTFSVLVASDPNFSQAWLYLARVQRDLFEIEEAEKSFEKALAVDPDYLEARTAYGGMLLDNGNYDRAIRELNRVTQRDRKQATAWYLLAQAQRIKEMYPQALESARQAIALAPDNGEAYFWLADSLRMSGKYAPAVEAYQKYLTLSDFDSKLAGKLNYYVLGYLAGIGKKKRAAQQDVWSDLRALAYFGMCDCERNNQHFDNAIGYCQRALRYDPQDPLTHYVLALSYARSASEKDSRELYAAALKHFRRMLELNPDLSESAYAKKNVAAIELALR